MAAVRALRSKDQSMSTSGGATSQATTPAAAVLCCVLAAALALASGQQCGSQAGGATCGNCLCCSQFGFCGNTSAYCGAGCQSQCSGCVQRCGSQAGGATCGDCLCCSQFGFCGSTSDYCGAGCQSQCTGCGPSPPGPAGPGVASVVSRDLFEQLLLHRNDAACPARGFYTYDAFLAAAAAFPAFGTTGGDEQKKREVAAFLGQTSHETTGGWPTAPDGPFSWGYCFKEEREPPSDYCDPRPEWPCAPGKKYFGRGPIQISFNYNYGPAGRAIGVDLLNNPDLVATDAVVSFKTALWFWMTARDNKPSCHAVITGQWTPTAADRAAGRGAPGYGVVTNVINGGIECGHGADPRVTDRIGFYKRYCDVFRISSGSDLDCDGQRPFNSAVAVGLAAQ